MKKLVCFRLFALSLLLLLLLLSPTIVNGQDMTDAQRRERCQNNKNRIAELERQSESMYRELHVNIASGDQIDDLWDDLEEVRKFKIARYITLEEEKKLNQLGAAYGWKYNDCLDVHDNAEGAQKICLAELEKKIVKIIDKHRSDINKKPELKNRLDEIDRQIADHRRNLVALGCNQITNTGVTKKQPGDEISGQDLTEGQKKDRCQNNKNRIAELETHVKQIDAELSQTMEKKEIEDARDRLSFVKKTYTNSRSKFYINELGTIGASYNFNYQRCVELHKGLPELAYEPCAKDLENLIVRKIDKAISLQNKRPGLVNKKSEIEKQLAEHRRNLIALGCNQPKNAINLGGTYTGNSGGTEWTFIISPAGSTISGSFTYKTSDSEGKGNFYNCNVVNNSVTVSCPWTAQHNDIHKTGTRNGTFEGTFSGNTLSGVLNEKTPRGYRWNWKAGHSEADYSTKMVDGAKWSFSVTRK